MFFLYKSEWNHPDNVSIAKTNYIFSLIQQCGDDLRTFTAINEKKEAYICECDVFICKNHHIAFSFSPGTWISIKCNQFQLHSWQKKRVLFALKYILKIDIQGLNINNNIIITAICKSYNKSIALHCNNIKYAHLD